MPKQVLGLGTDTGDTMPSVLLFFDNLRFLFNVGEGFQRFCVQVCSRAPSVVCRTSRFGHSIVT